MDDQTRCVTKPDVSFEGYDSLSVPICRASTIRFADAQAYSNRFKRDADGYTYGLYGTPTHRYLEKMLTGLEQGARTLLAPSGQAAITIAMLTLLKTGDSVLIPDTVYGPVRDFAQHELAALGIAARFYDPSDLTALTAAFDRQTRLVWVESPGSATMEVQDLPAIVALAHARGALVGCDNTWATPLYFKPLAHGADLVVEALSKYLSGHSDVLMGSITYRDAELGLAAKAAMGRLGVGTSPDDCALVLRGIETLAVRLERSSTAALALASWAKKQRLVQRVLHPAFEDCPGHVIWKRDFGGASSVFSLELRDEAMPHLLTALNVMKTFSLGASWGGTKSLIVPMAVGPLRSLRTWQGREFVLRLSIGLEALSDLNRDLEALFEELEMRLAGAAVPA